MSSVDVIIETMDGEVTSVSASDECNVAFIERGNLDPSAVEYREDVLGTPGMVVATYEADVPSDFDVHQAWLQIADADYVPSLVDGEECNVCTDE